MKTIYKISHNQQNNQKPIHFHSHDFYEIYFFVEGNVTYYIENEHYTLSRGDVLIIPPHKIHRPVIEATHAPYDRYVLWIYDRQIPSDTGILQFINYMNRLVIEKKTRLVSFTGTSFSTLALFFDRLLANFNSSQPLACYAAESCITLILDTLTHRLKMRTPVTEKPQDLIGQVITYINHNLLSTLSLDELASRFFVSKYYLSHKFKEHTQTTIHQYILMKKINLAKEYLCRGDSPQDVCNACGFSTYSNFYKAFTRQTGCSPGNYRSACSPPSP